MCSDFDVFNLDQECESAYFKCHRMLDEYMVGNDQSSMEIATSIRPMLEGFLHRRFPNLINGRLNKTGIFGSTFATKQDRHLWEYQYESVLNKTGSFVHFSRHIASSCPPVRVSYRKAIFQ